MNGTSDDRAGKPRSFHLSGGSGDGRILIGSGAGWLVLSMFVASPFYELWPVILISVPFLLCGIVLSKTPLQRITGVGLLLVSLTLSFLSYTAEVPEHRLRKGSLHQPVGGRS